jgi:hypothetical protein
MDIFTRRELLRTIPAAGAIAALLDGVPIAFASGIQQAPATSNLWPEFPSQNPRLVQEMVGKSHFDEKRVRELADLHPALINATWDWGFGDWETALGAASHTGRRSIAEFLIERGARPDIFAAAMLGWTDAVKAMVASNPGVQRNHGPHGIPLLAHAQAGGEPAKATLAYLESLGDAGRTAKNEPLPESQRGQYVGKYRFGNDKSDVLEVKLTKEGLSIERPGSSPRRLVYVGRDEFFPAGAPAVRIQFVLRDTTSVSVSVTDHELLVNAERIAG